VSAKYVMCINNKDYAISLALRKVYKVISTAKEEQGGWVRVVDDTDEDYLFPAARFVTVMLSDEAEQSFALIAV
jgi:hypothetical protein